MPQAPQKPKTSRITRRRFLKIVTRTIGVSVAAVAGGSAYASLVEPTWFEVNHHRVVLPRLPESFSGFKIAHLTDLHHSELLPGEYLEQAFAATMKEKPDLIAITGDFITGFRHGGKGKVGDAELYLDELCEMLKSLSAPHGVWGCLGNHDFWFDRRMVCERLTEKAGVRILRDNNICLGGEGERLFLVGFTDLWSEEIRWAQALAGIKPSDCTLAMMHNPDSFYAMKGHDLDLLLCGHTHGGQVRIPFLGAPVLPIENRQFAQGWFKEGRTQMYVNKGLGVIGIPVRFNVRPEIAIHELQPT